MTDDCDMIVKNACNEMRKMWTGPRAKVEHCADFSIKLHKGSNWLNS